MLPLTRDQLRRELNAEATEFLRAARSLHNNRKAARVAHRKEIGQQFVYVIGAAKAVKVGIAVDVRRRRKALQTANPHALKVYYKALCEPGRAREAERPCHQRLAEYRTRGEWFNIDPYEAVETVRAVVASL